jgi:hypothetical protein
MSFGFGFVFLSLSLTFEFSDYGIVLSMFWREAPWYHSLFACIRFSCRLSLSSKLHNSEHFRLLRFFFIFFVCVALWLPGCVNNEPPDKIHYGCTHAAKLKKRHASSLQIYLELFCVAAASLILRLWWVFQHRVFEADCHAPGSRYAQQCVFSRSKYRTCLALVVVLDFSVIASWLTACILST